MRLKNIKLAGFKSFVDPTTFVFPDQLVGIVGPNGCGKSNLIDAVRWVMGESSAKQLRGESMADVIFNGSNSRKPVGQASIELVFDNSAGRLGGEYASYAEIAIKRVLSRDGQSVYHLNGSRCRRRDITDIFLGTGLGPRSYAIIEQGMIGRVVDSSPEQLRAFLEEAAGISKYKERRRETENRIGHTRDNISRLNDLREEIQKHLEKLQRQSRNAERYKILKSRERELRAGLLARRWQRENEVATVAEAEIATTSIEQEKQVASQRALESRLESAREQQSVASETLTAVQARFYSAGAEVSRVEQAIGHERQLGRQWREDLARARAGLQEVLDHIGADTIRIAELDTYVQGHLPELQRSRSEEQLQREQVHSAEDRLSGWRDQWQALQEQLADPQRVVHVERTRIDYHERQLIQLGRRRQQLATELGGLDDDVDGEDAARLHNALEQAAASLTERETALASAVDEIRQSRVRVESGVRELDQQRDRLRQNQARLVSLETLQKAALKPPDQRREAWLQENGLHSTSRLGELLEVEPGWEVAVEAVLGDWLDGICVTALEPATRTLDQLNEASLCLLEPGGGVAADTTPSELHGSLLDTVREGREYAAMLAGIYRRSSCDEALAERGSLGSDDSFVLADGTRIGRHWLRTRDMDNAGAGVLARGREIEQLTTLISVGSAAVHAAEAELVQFREVLTELETVRGACQEQVNVLHRELASLRARDNTRQARLQQLERRRSTLAREAEESDNQIAQEQASLSSAREQLGAALQTLQGMSQQREALDQAKPDLQAGLEHSRVALTDAVERCSRLTVEVETRRSTLDSLRNASQRQHNQRATLETEVARLEEQINTREQSTKALEEQLEGLLQRRAGVEAELQEARTALEQADSGLLVLDRERLQLEQTLQQVRERLQQRQLGASEARVRCQSIEEQMPATGIALEQALKMLVDEAGGSEFEQQLVDIERRIQRLGPINLAAIEEFDQESERKRYLDAQNDDLVEALETLETAMKRIDRETRSRFQDTFDQVNVGLANLFPRLFGGGQAFLELVGEDVLDAGVAIMASPPGKRVSSIHLLSGGEKALTAIALVFTIFQLNPAPFCMLDEVDAPLDEANVERFSDLVREMSETVQLIVITHNKTTMEVVEHLVGVTMHEAGCSRLVSVDVEEAARLAAV